MGFRKRIVTLLTFALLAAGAPLAGAAPNGAPTPYLVGFHEIPDEALDGWYQGEPVERIDETLRFVVVHARNPDAFVRQAEADPNVRYVAYDDPNAFAVHATPDDPYYPDQYGWERVNAPAAWDTTYGSTGPVVAVLDTGLDKAHEDMDASRILQGYDFANDDTDPEDKCGHGTHVTGSAAAATNNGVGVAGASQSTILPVKVLEKGGMFGSCSGSFSDVASGIRWAADQGADVISMSFGCDGCYDQATADAIEYAWNQGALLVASAGNSGPCEDCVGFPADHPRVMAVACTDSADAQCSFSSQGSEVEIAAPGKDVLSTWPDNAYETLSGTSMSAPHVSGAAVLALSANESLTNVELRDLLQSTSKDLGPSGEDNVYGHGLLDMGALIAAAGDGGSSDTNSPPTASFTSSCTDLSCTFDASDSSDSDGSISSYAWDLGDGNTATGEVVDHTYASGGTYTVTLTVTDDDGATDTTSQDVTVEESSGTTMHVADISFDTRITGPWHRATALVTIVDGNGAPVPDATVTGTYTLPDGTTAQSTATTGSDGVAHLDEVKHRGSGTFELCVDDVKKSGATYDASANVETCDSVTA